jgi:hypothetical protein
VCRLSPAEVRKRTTTRPPADTFRPHAERGGLSEFVTLGDDWVEEALLVTPLPGDGVEPLERLEPPAEPAEVEAL